MVFRSLVLSSFHPVHFLVKSIRPPCFRKINPRLFCFPTRPPFFLLGAGVHNRVSILLVRSLLHSFLNYFNHCFVFSSRYSSVPPSKSPLFFPPSHPLIPKPESLSSINFICVEPLQSSLNYFNRRILVSVDILHLSSSLVDSIQVFQVDHILFPWIKCFLLLICLSPFNYSGVRKTSQEIRLCSN